MIAEIKRLQNIIEYKYKSIIVTGHSLGAAIATLAAIDMIISDIPVKLFNFGSPRIFNPSGAKYASNILNNSQVRVTHMKDIVPHVPPNTMQYLHITEEWYENEYNQIIPCGGEFENISCANQWKLSSGLNVDDHMWYLDKYIEC